MPAVVRMHIKVNCAHSDIADIAAEKVRLHSKPAISMHCTHNNDQCQGLSVACATEGGASVPHSALDTDHSCVCSG